MVFHQLEKSTTQYRNLFPYPIWDIIDCVSLRAGYDRVELYSGITYFLINEMLWIGHQLLCVDIALFMDHCDFEFI